MPIVLVLTVPPKDRELEADREAEMKSLLDTAGREAVAVARQHLQKPVSATCIGSGKIIEVAELVKAHGAEQVVFDTQLTPSQQRNLERDIGIAVVDYNELILDIFATNARTHQAMLAVQLAQLEYGRSRLKRLWTHLDRLGLGGSGGTGGGGAGAVRGPGEKQIEIDKRLVRKRIIELQEKLDEIERRKERTVAGRGDAFNIALVGYTNSGKSTLMNALTSAGVLAEDRLFATLDTRTAQLWLDGVTNAVVSDTVGFIRNLPPTLIASFHATLAEVREADLLLHVVDAASPVMDQQIVAVEEVLGTIGASAVPMVVVFNKVDRPYSKSMLQAYQRRYAGSVAISALTGEGLDALRETIRAHAVKRLTRLTVRFSAANGALSAFIRRRARITDEQYDGEEAVLTIDADARLVEELRAHPDLAIVA
ncbi:MAG: GTPase HflX [Planctomycetes bacterium]|nr:GTPase HflX [Planctomycetota bacterium]